MKDDQWIPWPLVGQVNTQEIGPILNNPYFRRLSEKKQLGFAIQVFPGASHDRREHSVGAYERTRRFTPRLLSRRLITRHEARNINLFGLLHDVGHGPFSHVIEPVTKINHEQYGLLVLDKMSDDIKKCGGDIELIKKYMAKDDQKFLVVSDKNFGMEKLDYLVRDQAKIQFGPNIENCVESVFNYLTWSVKDQKPILDIKALDAALEIVRAYIYFYRNVHLGKSTYNRQRFMQKLIFCLLNLLPEEGGIREGQLWEMVDGDLLVALHSSKNEMVINGMKSYDSNTFPKTALAIRPIGYGWLERIAGKKIKVFETDKSFFEMFAKKSKPQDLEQVESRIAQFLGLGGWQVIVSHIAEKHRFLPKDILFFDGPKRYSLKKQDPEYFRLLEKELEKYLCVRVCVAPEFREKLYNNWKQIFRLVSDFIGYNLK